MLRGVVVAGLLVHLLRPKVDRLDPPVRQRLHSELAQLAEIQFVCQVKTLVSSTNVDKIQKIFSRTPETLWTF